MYNMKKMVYNIGNYFYNRRFTFLPTYTFNIREANIMLEKFKNLREKKLGIITFLIIAVLVIASYKIIMNFEGVVGAIFRGIMYILGILTPFVIGGLIAYFLNPAVKFFECKVYGKFKRLEKFKTVFSLITVYALVAVIIILIVNTLIPILVKSIVNVAMQIPVYFDKLLEFRNGDWNHSVVGKLLYNAIASIENHFTQAISEYDIFSLNPAIGDIVGSVVNVTGTAIDVVFGIIISVYFILEKKNLSAGLKKILRAFFKESSCERIDFYGKEAHRIFSRFIVGQFMDSLIIGIICIIGLRLLGTQNSILYGAIVGVTNMIPYFGPFIGGVPVVLLVLFESPLRALWVGLFIFALQQADSMIMAPKIIGESVNLSPFWIIFAILVGGGLFGVIGMFLGAPALAFILLISNRWLDRKIERNKEQKTTENI